MTAQEDLTGMPTPGPWITHLDGDDSYISAYVTRLDGETWSEVIAEEMTEDNAAFIVKAVNAYGSTDALISALEHVMIGSNHLGLIIGADHPPDTATHEEARIHYGDAIWIYEAWCCWKAIRQARTALAGVTAPSEVE